MVTITFEKPRDIDHKIDTIRTLRAAVNLKLHEAKDAVEAGAFCAAEHNVGGIINAFLAAGLPLWIAGVDGRPARRPYSGPSRAVRLMHYRAAALNAFAMHREDFLDPAHVAAVAEQYAQAMLAAEKAPPRTVATTEGGGQ